ncbi:MAG: hypothetical protein AAGG44_02975, partial [Planctomycetota bacterium]
MMESHGHPSFYRFSLGYWCLAVGILATVGCGTEDSVTGEVKQKPRPIDVLVLSSRQPPSGM